MKKIKSMVLGSMVALSAVTACANEIEVATSLTATNNYVSRGMTQSNEKGAIFAQSTLSYGGLFGGFWASNIEFEGVDGDSEIDVYAGYATSFGDLQTIFTYTRFLYPSSDDLVYYDEAELKLSYDIGDLSVGAKYALGTYTENDGVKLDYVEGFSSYNFGILSLNGSYGSYEDIGDNFIVGVSKGFELSTGELNLDLSYTEFDSDVTDSQDQEHLYATITYSF